MHRLRTVRLAALLVGLMVAAACGGGDDEGGLSGGEAQIQEGGTLSFASDQEQAGFNPNTAKDNLFALSNIVTSLPVGVQHPPRLHRPAQRRVHGLGRADQRGPPDGRLQDQAERGLVGRHAGQRRRLHLLVGELQRDEQEGRLRLTTGYKDIASVTGSDGGKTVTTVYKNKFSD